MTSSMKSHAVSVLLFLIMVVLGCGQQFRNDPLPEPLTVELLDTGIQGPGTDSQASAQWITSRDQLRRVTAGLKQHRVDNRAAAVPPVDMDRFYLLWIQMGLKTTGGYSISLDTACSHVSKGKAILCLNWRTPPVNAALTQVMTSPYALLKLIKAGYESVVVMDQEQRVLFEMGTPD